MPVYEEKEKVNGQKRYYIRTYVTDEFGKRKQITRHNKTWIGRDGYWLAYQEESMLKSKKINKHENITLKELYNEYLNHKKPMLKLSTYLKYKDDIENYILPYFENKIARQITSSDILKWQDKINKLDLSIYTKKRAYTTFSSLIKYGCSFYDLKNNIVSTVDNFKEPKGKKNKKMNFITVEEFNNFIQYEKNNEYRNFFIILFYTGMRRGELLALTKDDIDFDKNIITINKTYSPRYKKYNIEETDPKTEKSNRELQMLNIVRETLKKMELKNNERIFKNIKLTTLKRHCDKNIAKANINKNIRIHDFRHSFASMCIDKDVPISIISEYLGHENISITLDTYSHLYPNSQKKLLDKLNL